MRSTSQQFQIGSTSRIWIWSQGFARGSRNRVPAARRVRVLTKSCPSSKTEGAGKAGCALHPRSRVQDGVRKRTRAYRFSGGNPAFPAQWFYGLLRTLPGDRAFLPPSPADVAANLMPASGHQDHTTSPSAPSALVRNTVSVHRIPLRVRDVAQRPSVWDGMAADIE